MRGKYILTDILHNGRKGIRGEAVDVVNSKYTGLIGCIFIFDTADIKQFKSFHMSIKNCVYYDYWDTSEVLAAAISKDGSKFVLETANTIYQFEVVKDDEPHS